jgi:hypothetical protein
MNTYLLVFLIFAVFAIAKRALDDQEEEGTPHSW